MGTFTGHCETNLRKKVCQASFVSARQPIICVVLCYCVGKNLEYRISATKGPSKAFLGILASRCYEVYYQILVLVFVTLIFTYSLDM